MHLVDHDSGYLHVEHQLGFSAVESIRAKQSFENMAFEHGVVVQSSLTDSKAFKANTFVEFPKMFGPKSGANVVLKLVKSLYRLRQAPRTFAMAC